MDTTLVPLDVWQKGYDKAVQVWVDYGVVPALHQCPAMSWGLGNIRKSYIEGWLFAVKEIREY